jgi:hypothetical protein
MRVPAKYKAHTVFYCPSCGRKYTTPIGVNAVECNKDHPTVQMKESK